MTTIAYEIYVHGMVQGVGFRYQALRAAETMDIKGYVKNNRDGTVFIFAEAEQAQMDEFVAWCKKGPIYARVSKVNVVKTELEGHLNFEIRRT